MHSCGRIALGHLSFVEKSNTIQSMNTMSYWHTHTHTHTTHTNTYVHTHIRNIHIHMHGHTYACIDTKVSLTQDTLHHYLIFKANVFIADVQALPYVVVLATSIDNSKPNVHTAVYYEVPSKRIHDGCGYSDVQM